MTEREGRRHVAKCSFCGKRQDQVQRLIAGPGPDVAICDRCIRLCNEILDEPARPNRRTGLLGWRGRTWRASL